MTVITEIKYILDPVKECAAYSYLAQAMASDRDGWEWEMNATTKSYAYIKRRSIEVKT